MTKWLVALATLGVAGSASGQQSVASAPQQNAPATAAASAPKADKKICRSEMATGSMMPKHTCHTKAEWAEIDTANSDAAQGVRDRMHGGIPR